MVLEKALKTEWMERRPYYAFILGLVYTLIGYFTSVIFFGKHTSIAMLFLTTLLLVPSLIAIISNEEKKESKKGLKHFFHNHKEIFEIFLFVFLGIFIGYLIIGTFSTSFDTVFSYQTTYLQERGSIGAEFIENIGTYDIPKFQHFSGLLTANLITTVIFFLLSFFYGAGGMFLILLNASIFASFIVYLTRFFKAHILSLIGAFSIHMIPEVAGFLLAAIAGGVISKALITEKFGSEGFKNVFRDAFVLLIIAFILVGIAAFLEAYVSAPLFASILQ